MSDEKPTSIWKKELSFKRKPAEAAPEAEPAVPSGAPTTVWKKEISLRRKPKQVAASAPVTEEPVQVDVEPAAPPVSVASPPVSVAPPPLAADIDHSWLTRPLELVSTPDDEPTVDQPEPVAAPSLKPEPVEALPPAELAALAITRETPLELPPELIEAARSLLAAEAAPEPAETEGQAQPFYRRELSLKRGPKASEPRAKRELSFRRPKGEPAPAAERPAWDETDVSKPFYKRELSFGRRPKSPAAVVPKLEQEPKPQRERPRLRRPQLPRPVVTRGKGGKNLVGLKIGASQIAAARIVNGDEPELVQVAREPLEPGIVVGGELRDPEALALALREFFKKHGLPRRGVRLGIANNRIGVRTFDVVGIDDPKQLANAIRFRAQEVLPIPIEEAVLDYQILSESTDEEGNLTRRVLLVVAYRELVDRYVHACQRAGIQIVGIDLEAFALLRALAEPREPIVGDDRGALVAVSVGHDRSTFAVSDGRVCEFTRVLEWGGWALNVAIARALDLSPSEAEPVKRALSLIGGQELPDGFDEGQLQTAREAARAQLQSFARELVSSLQFYQNQPGSLGIGEIVLTGGTTHLPGFAAELERLIGVPVRVGDPLSRVKVSKRFRESEQTGSFAIAIGLGIDD